MIDAIAIALALVALAVAGFAMWTVQAWRQAHQRLGHSLLETTARLGTATQHLNDALAGLRQETRMTVVLGDLTASAGLADVLTRIAVAAVTATGARGAVVRALDADGTTVVGSTGETGHLSVTAALDWPPDGARAMTFTLLGGTGTDVEPHVGSGVAVPIGAPPGLLPGQIVALFDGQEPPTELQVDELERLAARTAPIVAAARTARSSAETAVRDPLTGLATRQHFHQLLAREVASAHRRGTQLALLVLDIDDFRTLNELAGRTGGEAALLLLVAAVDAVAPPSAEVCRIGGDELALILPGSNRLDAELVSSRIRAENHDRTTAGDTAVTISSGVAELRPGDDALRLYERATRTLRTVRTPRPAEVDAPDRDVTEQG